MKNAFLSTVVLTALGAACLDVSTVSDIDVEGSVLVAEPSNLPLLRDPNQPSAELTVQMRRFGGIALVGGTVTFSASGCTIAQPLTPTDALGLARGRLTCSEPGQKLVRMELKVDGRQVDAPLTTTVLVYPAANAVGGVPTATPLNMVAFARAADGTIEGQAGGAFALRSSDPLAVLPPPHTLRPSDVGVHLWLSGVLLQTPGTQSIQAVDVATQAVVREETFEVVGGAASYLGMQLGSLPLTAGEPMSLAVAAYGADGRVLSSFASRVGFVSSDPQAHLPEAFQFDPVDAGEASFEVTFTTPGLHSLQAISIDEPATPALIANIQVDPGPAASLTLSLPAGAFTGEPVDAHVIARDRLGYPTGKLADRLHFASSDPRAVLPADAEVRSDQGGMVYYPRQLRFQTVGDQQVRIDDLSNPALSGAHADIAVAPVDATLLDVVAPADAVAGEPLDVTITARGDGGAVAQAYSGTVQLSSPSEPDGSFSLPVSFAAQELGTLTVRRAATLRHAGVHTLAASDLARPTLQGVSGPIVIAAGPADHLSVPTPITARSLVPFDVVVTACDSFGNPSPDYRGAVHVTTDLDPRTYQAGAVVLPGDGQFAAADQGVRRLSGGLIGPTGTFSWTVVDLGQRFAEVPLTVTCVPGPITTAILPNYSFPGTNDRQQYPGPLGGAVSVYDGWGNLVRDYRATARLDLGGLDATYSHDLVFGAAQQGTAPLTGTLRGSGHILITVALPPALPGDPEIGLAKALIAAARPANPLPYAQQSAFAVGFGDGPAVAMDAGRQPTLAWNATGNGSQVYLERFDGAAWRQLGTSASSAGISEMSGVNDQISVVVDPASDSPLVAWRSTSGGANLGAIMARFWDAPGRQWRALGPSASPGGITGLTTADHAGPSLAMWQGTPLVAYQVRNGAAPWQVAALSFRLGGWRALGNRPEVSTSGLAASQPALVVDVHNTPFVAYAAQEGSLTQIYVRRFDGVGWVGIAASDASGGISKSPGIAASPRLALDSAQRLWVAWQDTALAAKLQASAAFRQVRAARCDGASWQGVDGSTKAGGVSRSRFDAASVDIAVADNDEVVVSWSQRDLYGVIYPHLSRLRLGRWTPLDDSLGDSGTGLGGVNNYAQGSPRVVTAADGRAVVVWIYGNPYYGTRVSAVSWP